MVDKKLVPATDKEVAKAIKETLDEMQDEIDTIFDAPRLGEYSHRAAVSVQIRMLAITYDVSKIKRIYRRRCYSNVMPFLFVKE